MKRFASKLAIIAVGFAAIAGCIDRGPETIPVYGKVSFAGREAPKFCRLFFQSVKSETVNRPSSATVQPDGAYEVKSFRRSKGLLPGTYKIQVSYYDLKPGADPNVETNYVESVHEAGELVVDADADEVEHNIEVPPKTQRATAAARGR